MIIASISLEQEIIIPTSHGDGNIESNLNFEESIQIVKQSVKKPFALHAYLKV